MIAIGCVLMLLHVVEVSFTVRQREMLGQQLVVVVVNVGRVEVGFIGEIVMFGIMIRSVNSLRALLSTA